MAISPESFFNRDTSIILAQNAKREQVDLQLNNSFQVLATTVAKLSNELAAFSNSVVLGQKQENKIINDYIAEVSAKQKPTLSEEIETSFPKQKQIDLGELGGTNTQSMMKMLAGGLAAGGLASVLNNVLGSSGGDEDGGDPGQVDPNYKPPPGKKFTVGQLKELALSVGFNEKNAVIAAAVAKAESGGDSSNDTIKSGLYARTGETSYGLWQINWKAHKDGTLKKMGITDPEQLRDPVTNARVAFKLSGGSNWNPWTVYKEGKHLPYLKEAQKHKKPAAPSSPPSSTATPAATSSSSTATPAAGTPTSQPVSPAKPSSRVKIGKAEDTAQSFQNVKPSTTASALVPPPPEGKSAPMMIAQAQDPSTPPPDAKNTDSASGSANAGNWYSDVQRLYQGIAFSVG